jgi:mannose-1-phosphate guanylyltransferase
VIVIAGKGHVDQVTGACAAFGAEDLGRVVLIPEPAAKNTAPAIACGALYAGLAGGPERNILVLTSDHIIRPPEVFEAAAAAAGAFARQDRLVVFGVSPRAPETGYGYLETAEALSLPPAALSRERKRRGREPGAFRVFRFREKPDRETAERFVASGNFFWNSGMFAFSSKFILGEFRTHAPDLIGPFEKLRAPDEGSWRTQGGLRILENWRGLEDAYREAESISFDYAIAEKCGATVMIKADFDWIDVGSWDEYLHVAPGTTDAGVYLSGSDSCFVDSDIPAALCGVKDLIVVVRSGRDGGPPAVLIARKGETQRVREIVEQIRAAGKTELL